MAKIQGLFAREVLDAAGNPTIECTLWTDSGYVAATTAPSSTVDRQFTVQQLADNDPQWMSGKGVQQSIATLHTVVSPQIIGQDPLDQNSIDRILENLSKTDPPTPIDARLMLAVSQAALKLASLSTNTPMYLYVQSMLGLDTELYIPNTISSLVAGGVFGTENLDFAEFLVLPATHLPFHQELNLTRTIFGLFKDILMSKNAVYAQGETGALVPNLYSNSDVFELLIEAVKLSPYTFGQDMFFGLNAGAEHIKKTNKYSLKDRADLYSGKDLLEYYLKLRKLYHATYIEDPFAIAATDEWKKITAEIGETTFVVGNELIGSSAERITNASTEKLCNAVTISLVDQGTVTNALNTIRLAKEQGMRVIITEAMAETTDDFLADFTVGIGAEYVKLGPPNRGEHIAKYNRLWQIEQELQYHETSH